MKWPLATAAKKCSTLLELKAAMHYQYNNTFKFIVTAAAETVALPNHYELKKKHTELQGKDAFIQYKQLMTEYQLTTKRRDTIKY